jgi:hypothetical protein
MRMKNVRMAPRRVPTRMLEVITTNPGGNTIAEYIITSCEKCDRQIAMAAPYDGEPVLCAEHDHDRPEFDVTEDVIAFDDDPCFD